MFTNNQYRKIVIFVMVLWLVNKLILKMNNCKILSNLKHFQWNNLRFRSFENRQYLVKKYEKLMQ